MNIQSGWKHVVVFAGILLLPWVVRADTNGIQVTGTGRASARPDTATFAFAVSGRGNDLATVSKDVDARTAGLVDLCKRIGIEPKDIASSQVDIHPRTDIKTGRVLGYEVSRDTHVLLNDLGRYSELISGAIEAGITNIRNIRLGTTKRDALVKKALASAVAAARQKAEVLAKSAGVALGKAVRIDERAPPMEMRPYAVRTAAGMTAAGETAFEPGQITVRATVTVEYAIK